MKKHFLKILKFAKPPVVTEVEGCTVGRLSFPNFGWILHCEQHPETGHDTKHEGFDAHSHEAGDTGFELTCQDFHQAHHKGSTVEEPIQCAKENGRETILLPIETVEETADDASEETHSQINQQSGLGSKRKPLEKQQVLVYFSFYQ